VSRDLLPHIIEALNNEVIYPFFALEMLFDGNQTLRLWTGVGTLIYEGNSWFGTGNMLNIESVQETSEISAKGASVTLSGVPSEVLSLALSEPYQGRVANIYFGTFSSGQLKTESSDFILLEDDSIILLERTETGFANIFSGYMDQMNIEETGETSTIQLNLENKLVDLERARVARYTHSYQKSLYPADRGLNFVESLQTKVFAWGKKSEN
jgi:hypothetical protein